MYQLSIPTLSCGHCVATITKAVQALDSTASLQFAVSEHQAVVTTSVGLDNLRSALAEAGYPVEAAIEIGSPAPAHHCEMCG